MKLWKLSVLCLVIGLLFTVAAALQEQRELSDKLIRLHVIANSDAEADQQLKLKVRDALLQAVDGQNWSDRDEAEAWLQTHLPELQKTCEVCVRQNGSRQTVAVSLTREEYPTRVYDTFSLPAGEYLSLQVKLGAAAGKNWWCVVYPSICTASVSEWKSQSVFSPKEVRLMTGQSKTVTAKFKILEWAETLKKTLKGT